MRLERDEATKMTRPAPRPQYRSADYSLKYQVMLDTLNKSPHKPEPPFKFDAPLPPGVNDLNRPMLINTTNSKWKDLGVVGPRMKRTKYQQNRQPAGAYETELKQQRMENAKNNGELAALSKLMKQATHNASLGPGGGGIGGKPALNGASSQVRRSKSEPMYLPPIDERTLTPGSRKNQVPGTKGHTSPSYDVIKRNRHSVMDVGRKSAHHRPDSTRTQTLPTLSKVSEEKSKYKDGAFMKGVQRHTGKHNVNLALGRPPPKTPRISWDENNNQYKPPPQRDDQLKTEISKPEIQQMPLRLRDMDLAFPMKNKMEKIRKWHESQFQKHLKQWKNAGGSETDKKEEALRLLAHYMEKENLMNGQNQGLNKSKDDAATLPSKLSLNMEPIKPASVDERTLCAVIKQEDCTTVAHDEIVTQEAPQINPALISKSKQASAQIDADPPVPDAKSTDQNSTEPLVAKVRRGRRIKVILEEEHVVYTDASQYIEENNLLPPERSRRIHDWLDSIDFTQEEGSREVTPVSQLESEHSNVAEESGSETLSEFGYRPG